MQHFLLLLLLALLGLPACGEGDPAREPGPAPEVERRHPNLLLITVDTLRADRLGAYGYGAAHTPVADRLAARGALFENASTCLPRTTQAFASLFTSRYPHEHGVLEIGERLPERERTLAERLRDAGYATAGISANSVAGRLQGLDQGFQTFVGLEGLRQRYPIREETRPSPPDAIGKAEAVTREAVGWLRQQRDSSWFLWLLYFDPHWRYDPPPPFDEGLDTSKFWFFEAINRFVPRQPTIYFNLNGESARALPQLSELYDGEVAYTDSMIGRLLGEVERRSDTRNTLIVFTADHGESLGEHGYYYEHGDFVYDATVRIPLIFHQPGRIEEGRRVKQPVSILDVAPTVLSLLGFESGNDSDLAGRDLSGLIATGSAARPEPDTDRLIFAESGSALFPQNPGRSLGGRRSAKGRSKRPFRYAREGGWVLVDRPQHPAPALYDVDRDPALGTDLAAEQPVLVERLKRALEQTSFLSARWRMVRDQRWKLIRIPGLDSIRFELYDLDRDPTESENRGDSHPEVVDRLRKPLEDWARSIREDLIAEPRISPGDQEEIEERLRALGYVE